MRQALFAAAAAFTLVPLAIGQPIVRADSLATSSSAAAIPVVQVAPTSDNNVVARALFDDLGDGNDGDDDDDHDEDKYSPVQARDVTTHDLPEGIFNPESVLLLEKRVFLPEWMKGRDKTPGVAEAPKDQRSPEEKFQAAEQERKDAFDRTVKLWADNKWISEAKAEDAHAFQGPWEIGRPR